MRRRTFSGLVSVVAQLRDAGGNASAMTSSFVFVVDATAPTSSAGQLAAVTEAAAINIPYTASDDLTGVEAVTIWWRHRASPTGAWSAWQAGPSGASSPIAFAFDSGPGQYEFYSIAIDHADNAESAPAARDAFTTHDPDEPPSISASLTSAPAVCSPPVHCAGMLKVTGNGSAADDEDPVSVHLRKASITVNGGTGTYGPWTLATATDGAFDELSEAFTMSFTSLCQYGWRVEFRATAGGQTTTIQRSLYCGSGGPGMPAP